MINQNFTVKILIISNWQYFKLMKRIQIQTFLKIEKTRKWVCVSLSPLAAPEWHRVRPPLWQRRSTQSPRLPQPNKI